jgi:hypothetical protein
MLDNCKALGRLPRAWLDASGGLAAGLAPALVEVTLPRGARDDPVAAALQRRGVSVPGFKRRNKSGSNSGSDTDSDSDCETEDDSV